MKWLQPQGRRNQTARAWSSARASGDASWIRPVPKSRLAPRAHRAEEVGV